MSIFTFVTFYEVFSFQPQTSRGRWLFNVPPCLTLTHSMFCSQSVLCLLYCSHEKTAIVSLHSINCSVCVTQKTCLYRTISLDSLVITGWTVQRLKTGGGKIFRIHPDQPCGLTMGNVFFSEDKEAECGNDHPSQSSSKVEERVEVQLYSCSGP